MSDRIISARTLNHRLAPSALGLVIALAITGGAQADDSPQCDVVRKMTWNKPTIDPAKDITHLIEKRGVTIGGKVGAVNVLAIKDIRRSPFTDEQPDRTGRMFCYAIVETDHSNFIFKFWYQETLAAAFIHGINYRILADNLPDDITIEGVAPYLETAKALTNQYVGNITSIPACKLRNNAWGDALRAKLLAAVQRDRPDLLAHVKSSIALLEALSDANSQSPDSHRAGDAVSFLCNATENKEDARRGDEVIAGVQSIWGDIFDRRP